MSTFRTESWMSVLISLAAVGGSLSEVADLGGDDGKAATLFARPSRLDGGVEEASRFVWKAISSIADMMSAISSSTTG